jgi:diguanylate cyclase (GGDEF)-like protein
MGRKTTLLYKGVFGHSEMVGSTDINIRCAMLRLIIIIGVIMTILFSSYTYEKTGNISEYLYRMLIVLPYIISFIIMGYGGIRLFISYLLTLIPLFATFVSMFYDPVGTGNTALFQGLWVLCVPLISIVAGMSLAIISCSLVFIAMLLICFIPYFGYDYPHEVSFRYLATYLTNCIFAFAYVFSRNKLHQEYIKELKSMGQIDPLTGVFNRRGFQLYADELWTQAAREKFPLSFLIIDICNFKKFNDDYGHQNGDSFLIKCVKILRQNVKSPLDLIVRPGGKEFGMLLFNTTQEETEHIAKKIKSSIEKETFVVHEDNKSIHFLVNIGIASVDFSEKSDKQQHKNLDEMFAFAGHNLVDGN